MDIRNWTSAVLAAAAISAVASSASASVIAFDDAFQNGCEVFDAAAVVDSPAPRHPGDKAVEGTASIAWQQIGVSLNNMVIPADATKLQFDVYFPTANCFGNAMVQLGGPTWAQQSYSDGSNSSYLTVDGKSFAEGGSTAAMVPGTWYTLTMDLPGAYGATVTPGTTTLLHVVTQTNSPGTFYMDNVQLVSVPEPASIGLLGLTSLALLRRRHAH